MNTPEKIKSRLNKQIKAYTKKIERLRIEKKKLAVAIEKQEGWNIDDDLALDAYAMEISMTSSFIEALKQIAGKK